MRWWEGPRIVRHVNERICGVAVDGLGAAAAILLKQHLPGRVYPNAISVGCGEGVKEMALVQTGLIGNFHLYEIAEARVEQDQVLAERLGIADQITFRTSNAFDIQERDSFDLVHWDHALHHMLDVNKAVTWSREMLKVGGVFYMDDFVGPSRMQWSNRTLRFACMVRRALPERYLKNHLW